MYTNFNLLFRKIVIIAIILTPFISFSQQNIFDKAVDTNNVVKPVAIQMTDVIAKIEEANKEIKSIENKIKTTSDIKEIDSLFPLYVSFIKEQKKRTQIFIKENPDRQKVNHLIKKWDSYYLHLSGWETTINNHEDDYAGFIDEGSFNEQTWKLTYQNAVSEKVPREVLVRINDVLKGIKKIQKSIFNKKNNLLRLESKINKQKSLVNNVIEDLGVLKSSGIYDIFYLRHEPLWKTSMKKPDVLSIEKELVESLPKNIAGIIDFLIRSESNIYLFMILIGLIIFIIIYIKKIYTKYEFNEPDKDLQYAKDIVVNHSLSAIIFLSILMAYFFIFNSPTLFGQFLMLFVLIASVPLVNPYMYKRFKRIPYFVISFYILDTIKNHLWLNDLQHRFYLLFEATLIIATLIYFTYPYYKTRKMNIGGFGKLLIRVTPVLYFLSIVSIISNILGYTNLADLTVRICTQSSVITIVFYGILMISGGLIIGLIHSLFIRKTSFDQVQKFNIEKKSLKFIRAVVIFYWIYFFLKLVDLWLPLTEYLTIKLSSPFVIGTVSFTIGSILTFILILTISFLISSFISFLLDGDSLKYLKLPKGIPSAISLVVRYFIIAFGFVLALSALGIDLGKFNLMAGALGLGIGFGLQTVISNFVSGLILIFERPILPGDTVEVNDLLGTVKRIGVRSSTISTFDGAEVVVPNNNLVADDLINWTLSDNIKRIEILIGTTYGSDPNEILKILSDVAFNNEDVLKQPEPQVLFSEFGDSSLNFKLRCWVHYEMGLQVKSDVSIAVYNKFKELGVEIPFPQQDIYIKEIPNQIKETEPLIRSNKKLKPSKSKSDQIIEPLDENSDAGIDTEQ